MPARLFLVVGVTKDPTRVWPVVWSVDRADCVRTVEACKAQAKAFVDELTPIWAAMEALYKPEEWREAGYSRVSIRNRRNKNYDHEMLVYGNKRTKLECDEHEINVKHRDSMLDPLFPTGNDGWCPEVEYIIWPLHEDMRSDLTAGQLMLIRAKLHGAADEDSLYKADE